ncbi:class I SAM-dependent methyltransferase [Paenibacillus sp. HB172176]|uniref:class I SAM-dependent methyltransferase n=1 Tax=Paenibacillus sp. HB172176 TaxID=2493690 RepID=UPI00143BE452|nr:class I SAM-dependent methyltransferase [Paenibacillus sp. HB172176]
MIVTTAAESSERVQAQAARLASELGARQIARRKKSLGQLIASDEDATVMVVTEREVRFYAGDADKPLFFHPSMALVRVKRLAAGEKDPLISISGCKPGDCIIDCTAGMASDSLVFAFHAGERGEVTAIESEPALAVIVREGLAAYKTGLEELDAAMRGIRLINENHLDYLASLPDNSADIVYFDPMFRQPLNDSSSMNAMRGFVNVEALRGEAIAEAMRVARRTVILKEHQKSGEFERLGFRRVRAGTTKIAYGVIDCE